MHCTRNIAFWDKLRTTWFYLDSIQKSVQFWKKEFTRETNYPTNRRLSSSFARHSAHLHNFIKPDGIDVERVHLDISSIRGPVSRSRALPRTCPARPGGGSVPCAPRKVASRRRRRRWRRRRCASREMIGGPFARSGFYFRGRRNAASRKSAVGRGTSTTCPSCGQVT